MDYSNALKKIRAGAKMQRVGWNGKNMFIFMVPGSTFKVSRPPLMGIFPEGTEVKYGSHIDIYPANGVIRPWICSQEDQFADDWQEVEN